VQSLVTRSDGRARSTSRIHDMLAVVMLGVVEQGLKARLREAPCTGVERLLLAPNNGLGVGVLVKVLLQLLPREGVKLLEAGESNVVNLVVSAVLGQSSPDLTRAEDDAVNLLLGLDGAGLVLGVRDDPAEVRVIGELLNVGASQRVAEQSLGEEDDEWLAELTVHLSTEHVEQVGGTVI